MKILLKVIATAAALWVADLLLADIKGPDGWELDQVLPFLVVAVIFGLINAFLKPIIKTVGCAFYVLTLGLFALVVNAGLLLLTSWIAGKMDLPFHVEGFWAAFWGAIIVGVVSWLLSLAIDRD